MPDFFTKSAFTENLIYRHPTAFVKMSHIYKQFDFTAAILLNGGCEGQIKVRCEIFDKFEIAIHLAIH